MSTNPPSTPRQPGRTWTWIALLLAVALYGAYSYQVRSWMLDDAFISFRYAENFAAGHGPVFNPGERVEGYTTFLWVALLALADLVGFSTITASRWLGVASTLGTIGLIAFSHRIVPDLDRRTAAVATLFLGSYAVFTSWSLSGMEVALTGMLVLATVLLHLREARFANPRTVALAGIFVALATMARPESVLLFGCLLAARMLEGWRSSRRGWFVFGAAYSALYGPYFLWRWSYYGWFLPNTFYAKVGSTWNQVQRGIDYFLRWSEASLPLLALVLLAAVLTVTARIRVERLGIVPILLAVHVAYVIAVGGDGQAAFRFFATMTPILCLLAAIGLERSATGMNLAKGVAVLATLAFNLWQTYDNPEMKRGVLRDQTAARGEIAGRWLREHSTPEMVIATNTAGTIPYFSGLRAIDMLGLNDSHIAHREVDNMGAGIAGHEKADGAYVLSRKPDYIMFDSAMGSRTPRRPSDAELFGNPDFHAAYTFRRFPLTPQRSLGIYLRNPEPETPSGATPSPPGR